MLLSGYRNFKHRGGQYCSIGITIMKRSTAIVRENVNVLVSVPKCKDNPTSTSRTLETSGQHTQLQSTSIQTSATFPAFTLLWLSDNELGKHGENVLI